MIRKFFSYILYIINIYTLYIQHSLSEILCFIPIYWHRTLPDFSSQNAVLTHIYSSAPSITLIVSVVLPQLCFWSVCGFQIAWPHVQLPQCLIFQVCRLTWIWPLGQHSGTGHWLSYFKRFDCCIAFTHNVSVILCYFISSIAVTKFLQDAAVI